MRKTPKEWSLLIYKLPPHPTRLRLSVWRKLQAMGTVYVQDGVAALPSRPDLDENLGYVATAVEEMGGTATLLRAAPLRDQDQARMVLAFRRAADMRLAELLKRLQELEASFPEVHSLSGLMRFEEALRRERATYLKARRLNYLGSSMEEQVELALSALRAKFDEYERGTK